MSVNGLNIRIETESDWAVGSGAGRPGDVDRLVRRDHEGLPYVPGKHLTGLWRDACEAVAWGLDGGQEGGPWAPWVAYLFGDQPALAEADKPSPNAPRPAAISVRAARLPEPLRAALAGRPALIEALTFTKPGVRIGRRTGRALADHLRFEEKTRLGTPLEATCEFLSGEPLPEAARALLAAGTLLLTHLGGKRRRGGGKCKITLADVHIDDELKWIEDHPGAAAVPDFVNTNRLPACSGAASGAGTGGWQTVELELEALTPLVVSDRTVGNVNQSLDYVPGTLLLPLVTKTLGGGSALAAAVARGDVLVTHATPLVDGAAGRTVPAALFYEKMGGGLAKGTGVHNRLAEPGGDKQLKGYRSGYVGPTPVSTLPAYMTAAQGIQTHNTINDRYQRPNEDVGGVYSYEAIAAGSRLRAEVRVRESVRESVLSSLTDSWEDKLTTDYNLGAAKKDDYGHVAVKVLSKSDALPPMPEKDTLTVWLLSDVLLRDARLRPTTSVVSFAEALGKELGAKELDVTLKPRETSDKTLTLLVRRHRTDSWHTGWTLPRPSLVGLAAGSCLVFDVTGTIDPAKAAQVQAGGLGERRAEGYGQMRLNDPLTTEPANTKSGTASEDTNSDPLVDKPSAPKPLLPSADPSFAYVRDYAREVECAAWRQVIRREALGKCAEPIFRKECLGIEGGKPSQAQLGALRSALSALHTQTDRPGVVRWIDSTRTKRPEKWPANLDACHSLVTDLDTVWTLLGIDLSVLTMTEDGEAKLKEKLWAEAVRTLAGACIHAATRNREQQNTQEENDGS